MEDLTNTFREPAEHDQFRRGTAAIKIARQEFLVRKMLGELQSSVDRVAGMMDRCVNYGTHLIPKFDNAANNRDIAPAIMLTLHAVETLDAIAVLVRKGCVDPAKALLRSQMEAMFGLAYMAQGDLDRKAVQYLVSHAHTRINWHEKLDPTTESGKQLKAQLNKDSTFRDLDIVVLNTTANVANLERMLGRPEYAAVESEWQRVRRRKKGQIWWYSLYDGPKNIEDLAATVGDHAWYEVVYRSYSGEVHATNALESLHASRQMRAEYQPLRYPKDLPFIAQISVSMALRTYRRMIDLLLPSEQPSYVDWYMKEIKPDFDGLATFKIDDINRPSKTPPKR